MGCNLSNCRKEAWKKNSSFEGIWNWASKKHVLQQLATTTKWATKPHIRNETDSSKASVPAEECDHNFN